LDHEEAAPSMMALEKYRRSIPTLRPSFDGVASLPPPKKLNFRRFLISNKQEFRDKA
jgi:hypothetical protein